MSARKFILSRLLPMLLVANAFGADAGVAADSVWSGTWSDRFGETQAEWTLELAEGAHEVAGTLRSGGSTWTVTGKREGAWLELTWKDADGRTIQARGVAGDGQWRGLTLSGGGGHLVEYGRFALRLRTNATR